MTKKELQLIINNQWTERRLKSKERSLNNSRAAAKWKAREKELLEKAKSMMTENIENIKRQHHYLENSKNQKKTT